MLGRKFLGSVALTALGLAIAPPAIAQETTSGVRGEVLSAEGNPIVGATVVVIHTPSGTRAKQTTQSGGLFDLRGLRVGGPYTIEVNAANYNQQRVEGVYLGLGGASNFDLKLTPSTEAVVVTAKRVADSRLSDPGSRAVLGRAEIASVVTTRRDLRDVARRDPLVTIDNVTRGTGPTGGIYIAGSTPRLNRITIDGVRSADDFGLNTGGMSTTRGPVSLEAVEQMTVQPVPFDVEEGDFTGGAVNLVLRGGGNEFHGSAFANYQNDGLVGTKIAEADSPLTVSLQNYGGFLSGPIWKDKIFFAASYEYYKALDPNAFNGPADLGFINLINGPLGSAGPKLTTTDLASANAAWNTYVAASKLKPQSFPLTTPTRDVKDSFRFDFNLMEGQRLQAEYRHAGSQLYKAFGAAATASPVSNWYIQSEIEDNYALQLNSSWTDNLSTEGRVTFRSYIRGQNPPEGQGFANISVCLDAISSGDPFNCNNTNSLGTSKIPNTTPVGQTTYTFGPDQFRQANQLKTKDTSADFSATYRIASHAIKVGAQTKRINIFNLFVPQANGLYYFDSIADFQAGVASRLQYQNNTSGDPLAAAAAFSYSQNALFLQDSWDITDRLTVNAGLRYDFYGEAIKPALNTRFQTRYGFNNQTTYDGLDVLMPRLSFKFDPLDKVRIAGGVGLYSGGVPDVFLSNSYSNTGVLTYAVDLQRLGDGTCRDNTGQVVVATAICDPLLLINKASPTFAIGVPGAATPLLASTSFAARTAETNSLAPNFQLPSDWKANLSIKWDFMDVWRFGFDNVYSTSNEAVAFRDIRARPLTINGVQQLTPDGRIRYDALNLTAAARMAQGLPAATDVDLTNLGNSRDIQAYNPSTASWAETAAFSVQRTWDALGLDMMLAYVVQRAENYGSLAEFSTTASGFYGDQFSALDPNASVSGTASNQIANEVKASLAWRKNFFGQLASRFAIFAEDRTGRPYSFLMTDAASGRGPVFGVNRNDQLLYVPDLGHPDAVNPLKFTSPSGTVVFFDSATTLGNFQNVVARYNLPVNRITPKGFGENPHISQVDFQYDQELPGVFTAHRAHLTFDVKNVLNLLNDKWGLVKEYGDSRGGTGNRIVSVQCADANGNAQTSASAVCAAYRYTSFNSGAGSVGGGKPNIDTSSRWYLQIGLKYEF